MLIYMFKNLRFLLEVAICSSCWSHHTVFIIFKDKDSSKMYLLKAYYMSGFWFGTFSICLRNLPSCGGERNKQ